MDSRRGAYVVRTFHWDRLRICKHNSLVHVFGRISYWFVWMDVLIGVFALGFMAIAYIIGKSIVTCRGSAKKNRLPLGVCCCGSLNRWAVVQRGQKKILS